MARGSTYVTNIPSIAADLDKLVAQAIREGVEEMAAEAKANAPDAPPFGEGLVETIEARTGQFGYSERSQFAQVAESFGMATPSGPGRVVAEEQYGIWAAWYWYFVEFGTSHSAPKPFLIPAVERKWPEVQTKVKWAMRKAVLKNALARVKGVF